MIITPPTRFPFRIFLKSTRPPWPSILVKLISTPFQFNRANYSKWVWELYLAGSTFISIGIFGQNMMPLCPSMYHSSKYTLLLNPSLQDDSYQLKNDIGVNPTFWTEEMCHYAESPFRLFPFGKLFKSLKDCVEFQFSGPGWLPHLKQFGIAVTWSLELPATCTASSQVPIGKHWRFLYFLSVIFKITSCTSCQWCYSGHCPPKC